MRVLFVCGKNQWRSPTAEHLFCGHPGVECLSAGLSRDAPVPLSHELLDWADTIFVMEKKHKDKLQASFKNSLKNQRLVCLHIPDRYTFMDPELIKILKRKVTPLLG
ncbi:MAG: phosphotyrosine protein phosphatase [Brachymonas sp.]|nr:phosphotyrosine protein phosphatase [Brachymonas sp.]